MKKTITIMYRGWACLAALALFLAACGSAPVSTAAPTAPTNPAAERPPSVLAVETFLADVTQNVAGDRLTVQALIPLGLDPHAFEPTPQDVAHVADSQVLVINGGGVEEWLTKVLDNAGGEHQVIDASNGLTMRTPGPNEVSEEHQAGEEQAHEAGDPHFWLDPNNVVHYVESIRDGLIQADPAGEAIYTQNASAYIAQLNELDGWIRTQVEQIPAERRLLVTNHESLGYFADRYGFTIVGAIIPSVSTNASPSAQQLAGLVQQIQESGAPAIFLETGANEQLAQQLSSETGVKVVTGLYSHSVSAADGPAPTYLAMMRYNVTAIVDALK